MSLERTGLCTIIPTREGAWILSLAIITSFKGLHNCPGTLVTPLCDYIWDKLTQHLFRKLALLGVMLGKHLAASV